MGLKLCGITGREDALQLENKGRESESRFKGDGTRKNVVDDDEFKTPVQTGELLPSYIRNVTLQPSAKKETRKQKP
jgi:hypothetical protein